MNIRDIFLNKDDKHDQIRFMLIHHEYSWYLLE